MSYGYTTLLCLQHQNIASVRAWSERPPQSEAEYAEIPLLFDLNYYWHGDEGAHLQRRNVAFLDGHVASAPQYRFKKMLDVVFELKPQQ